MTLNGCCQQNVTRLQADAHGHGRGQLAFGASARAASLFWRSFSLALSLNCKSSCVSNNTPRYRQPTVLSLIKLCTILKLQLM